jgi:hypothetical protein
LNDEKSGISKPVYAEGSGFGGTAEIRDLDDISSCLSSVDTVNGSANEVEWAIPPTLRSTSSFRTICAQEGRYTVIVSIGKLEALMESSAAGRDATMVEGTPASGDCFGNGHILVPPGRY